MSELTWTETPEGALVAETTPATLTVYEDTQDPSNPGWAWRVRWEDGREESGEADSREDAMIRAAEWL